MNKYFRRNIKELSPYSTARDEYSGTLGVFLDANENPYDTGLNRYPDPYQKELKKRVAAIKKVEPKNIFLGNGSDEPIDLLYRIFCEPREDSVISIEPSYGMYRVAAAINDVGLIPVRLNADFGLDADALLAAVKPSTKMVFLCSPNNPSGNLLDRREVIKVIEGFDGIVIVDEAYIDFADDEGFVPSLSKYPNLVVLYTFSKAWGLAGVRLGVALASPQIVDVMSRVKYPYNIGVHTQKLLLEQLSGVSRKEREVEVIKRERARLVEELKKFNFVEKVYPSDANFLLVKVDDARGLYDYLIGETLIVRDRSRVCGCESMLRITVGRPEENDRLLKLLEDYR